MKKKKLKKKLVGGHNIIYKFLVFIFLFLSKNLYSSQIYDFQTEKFIEKLNSSILSVNSYNKDIKFRIIKDDFPNAYVTEDNTIYLSSGLLVYSPDYVSLLGVLAHEIGHIEKYHVANRKREIKNLKDINSFGNLAAIVGSMIIKEPTLINAVVFNQTTINNMYISFSQQQEIEADFYAVETINNLNLPTDSIKEFLILLENKTKFDLLDDELKKFSTHPLFEERQKILDFKKNKKEYKYNNEIQKNFEFIKAKFMAYTDSGFVEKLDGDSKIYYDSIQYSKSGNLKDSLKKLNLLISNNNNLFLIETKADILLSFGYNKEAINFYKQVLKTQPQNNYIKYNIFTNIKFKKNDDYFNKNFFLDNLNLISLFPNNAVLISKYHYLSKLLKYDDWILFFEILLFDKDNFKNKLNQLKNNTEDYNLKKIIKIYT